jgi:hypothetical protein
LKTFYGIVDTTHGSRNGGYAWFVQEERSHPERGDSVLTRMIPIYPYTDKDEAERVMQKHFKEGTAYIVSVEHETR